MNTGINPDTIKYDEWVSVDQRLRQIQNDRGNITNQPNQQNQPNGQFWYNGAG